MLILIKTRINAMVVSLAGKLASCMNRVLGDSVNAAIASCMYNTCL